MSVMFRMMCFLPFEPLTRSKFLKGEEGGDRRNILEAKLVVPERVAENAGSRGPAIDRGLTGLPGAGGRG